MSEFIPIRFGDATIDERENETEDDSYAMPVNPSFLHAEGEVREQADFNQSQEMEAGEEMAETTNGSTAQSRPKNGSKTNWLLWGAVAVGVIWMAAPTVMKVRNGIGRVFGGG